MYAISDRFASAGAHAGHNNRALANRFLDLASTAFLNIFLLTASSSSSSSPSAVAAAAASSSAPYSSSAFSSLSSFSSSSSASSTDKSSTAGNATWIVEVQEVVRHSGAVTRAALQSGSGLGEAYENRKKGAEAAEEEERGHLARKLVSLCASVIVSMEAHEDAAAEAGAGGARRESGGQDSRSVALMEATRVVDVMLADGPREWGPGVATFNAWLACATKFFARRAASPAAAAARAAFTCDPRPAVSKDEKRTAAESGAGAAGPEGGVGGEGWMSVEDVGVGWSVALADVVLASMQRQGVQPDVRTFNILLDAAVRDPTLARTRFTRVADLLVLMRQHAVEPDVVTCNSVLNACALAARNGSLRGDASATRAGIAASKLLAAMIAHQGRFPALAPNNASLRHAAQLDLGGVPGGWRREK